MDREMVPMFPTGKVNLEYKIVSTSSTDTLEKTVNEFIEVGWEPLGGIQVFKPVHWSLENKFYQAMTRETYERE